MSASPPHSADTPRLEYAGNFKCARRIVADYLSGSFELQRMHSRQKARVLFFFSFSFNFQRTRRTQKGFGNAPARDISERIRGFSVRNFRRNNFRSDYSAFETLGESYHRNHVAFAGKEHLRFDKLSLADVSHVNLFPNGAVSKQRTRDYGNIFHEEEKRGIIKMFPS